MWKVIITAARSRVVREVVAAGLEILAEAILEETRKRKR